MSLLLLAGAGAITAEAREWKDVTGIYKIEADLVGFDETTAILQRENKELGAFPIEKLSDADREFLKSKAALETHEKNLGALQTWTTAKGVKIVGKIVDYAQRDVTIQRRRGRLFVNDKLYDNLPQVYQRILNAVVEHFENFPVNNRADLDRWVLGLRGAAKTYTVDGVIMELENGDEYGVPFFLFSEGDRKILEGGFAAWLSEHGLPEQPQSASEYVDPNEHQLRLQSLAAAFQQNQQINQQIAIMNLNMQAIQAGLTSAWEVTLYPAAGNPNPPRWVVTLGRNSEIATQIALQENPGFFPGPVRRVSN
jgi:hypothetical protein